MFETVVALVLAMSVLQVSVEAAHPFPELIDDLVEQIVVADNQCPRSHKSMCRWQPRL